MEIDRTRRHAPATRRNREPILAVLRRVLPARGLVLEVASGTGEHVAFFARHLPELAWQPADADPEMLPSIAAWARESGAENVRPPLVLDVRAEPWPLPSADAVLSINMIHIAPWQACEGLFRGASRTLPPGGLLYLYGPFKIAGAHTALSNAAFDRSLRAQDPSWGVRDLDEVRALAEESDIELLETIDMPANNLSVIFRRR